MGMNNGMIYKVTLDKGNVTLSPYFALPGFPVSMNVTTKDRLLVNCMGGLVEFSSLKSLKFHKAPDVEEEQDDDDDPFN